MAHRLGTPQDRGKTFEDEVADVYRLMGYDVRQNVDVCGQEVDILAQLSLAGCGAINVIVECKYKPPGTLAGNDDVQSIAGAYHVARSAGVANAATLITTHGFSRPAQIAAEAADLRLLTYRDLLRSVLDTSSYSYRLRTEFTDRFGPDDSSWYIDCKARWGKESPQPLIEIVDRWLTSHDRRPLAILGGYGTGKSSFCLRYATYLLGQEKAPIPVILRLREFPRLIKIESLVRDFMDEQLESRQPRFASFQRLHEAGHIVVMLDGFDEMAVRVDSATLESNLIEIDRIARIGPTLLTCRPEFFVTQTEQDQALRGMASTAMRNRGRFEIAELELWTDENVKQYVRRRMSATPQSERSVQYYLECIDHLPGMRELSARPVHLELLVRTLPELVSSGEELNRPKIFETYLRQEMRRETVVNKRLQLMGDDDRVSLMRDVAAGQADGGLISLDFDRAKRIVAERFQLTEVDAEPLTRDFLNRSFLQRRGDHYVFAHKAIGEYLLACELHRRLVRRELDWLATTPVTELTAGLVLEFLGGARAFPQLLDWLDLERARSTEQSDFKKIQFAVYAMLGPLTDLLHLGRKFLIGGHAADGRILFPVGLVHDMRNSAVVVIGYIDDVVAAEEDRHRAIAQEWAAFCERASILSRVSFGAQCEEELLKLDVEPFDLIELVNEVATSFVGAGRFRGVSGQCAYIGDRTFIRRAIENIAANAAKFMGPTDVLRVAVWWDAEERVVIEIENTGSEIAPAMVERIFEVGFTSRGDGFGIGLAVARLFIELHGGHLDAIPSGDRARFRIRLPRRLLPDA